MRLIVGTTALLFAALLATAAPAAAADNTYTISVSTSFGESHSVPELEAILNEAYHRLGMTVDFRYYPLVRDALIANEGQADACAIKTRFGVVGYRNLRIVPVPLFIALYVALVPNREQAALAPDQLRQLRFVAIRGDRVASALLEENGITPHLAPTITHAIQMIQANRADAVFTSEALANRAQEEVASQPMYRAAFSETVPGYHVVNVRHEQLVEPLANIFRQMLREGTAKKLAGKYASMIPAPGKP